MSAKPTHGEFIAHLHYLVCGKRTKPSEVFNYVNVSSNDALTSYAKDRDARESLVAALAECRSILLGIRKAHASDWPMITVQRMDEATSRALIALAQAKFP